VHSATYIPSAGRPLKAAPRPPAVVETFVAPQAPQPFAPEPETVLTTSNVTTSVSRTYEHLHYPTFIGLCSIFAGARAIVYHPMAITLARKQALADYGHLSTSTILRQLLRHEGGIKALTTGMLAVVLANSLSETIYCGLFECLRYELPFASEVSRDTVAGYASDLSCRLVYTPCILMANRQMTRTAPIIANAPSTEPRSVACYKTQNGLRHVATGTYRAEGVQGFFRGFGATVVVGGAWSAIWWAMYAQTKRGLYEYVAPHVLPKEGSWMASRLPEAFTSSSDNVLVNGFASLLTSGSTAVIFNPFLVARTRLQIQAGSTMRSVCRQVLRESGWRGFFKGTTLSVATCIVDGVLASTSYEYAKYLSDTTH